MQKWKDRKFLLLLYPEDESHISCLSLLHNSGYNFAGCRHDKDTWEEGESVDHPAGEVKKPHIHIVLKFNIPRWSTAVADELGITHNYLHKCGNTDSALRYLIHADHFDKYQYELSEVFGPLTSALAKLLISTDEGSRVLQIVQMIDDAPRTISYRELLIQVCNAGLYGDFRRLGSGVRYLLDEKRYGSYAPGNRCD